MLSRSSSPIGLGGNGAAGSKQPLVSAGQSCTLLILAAAGKYPGLTSCLAAWLEGGLPGAAGRGELNAKSLDISVVLAAASQSDTGLTSAVEQQSRWVEDQFAGASLPEKLTSCCCWLLC